MRKIVVLALILAFFVLPVVVFAQTDKELQQAKSWLGQWKRNFASPTYGAALFHARLEGGWSMPNNVSDDQREFPATAVDLRIFRGVNVSKRGGFYTGVEAGVLFLQPFGEITFDEPNLGQKMGLMYNGGLVFLMAKYGLRVDIGIALFGISLGAELGMGGTLFAGGFEFYTGSKEDPDVQEGYGSDKAAMGLILDTAAEAAIRLGKNFRLVTKVGVMAAPIPSPENDEKNNYFFDDQGNAYNVYDPNAGTTESALTGDEYARAVMSQYRVQIDPFALDLRIGFVLNFQ